MQYLLRLSLCVFLCQACSTHSKADAPAVMPASTEGVASKNGTFFLKMDWTTGPKSAATSAATLSFYDANHHQAISVDSVAVVPWMTTMGHGTAMKDQKIVPVAGQVGHFTIDGIYLIMGGPWDIRVTATVNGSVDTATVAVTAP